ncbi:MAG TPA: LysR family transcriptional regulator [Candidatus Saccharimonadales bacterium]|nr:LysR family transcriptional regulator [Candidatus Saccharimonadales bacterium]
MEERLIKFAKVVDVGGVTRAAQQLHISQPALSSAIKKLERELQAELIKRGTRGLKLTPAGQLAYQAGTALAIQQRNLKQQLAELSSNKIALAIGMIDSIAETLFVHGQELEVLEQWARVALSINNSTALIQGVMQHMLDVAIIAAQPSLSRTLTVQRLGNEPLVLVVHPHSKASLQAAMQQGIVPNFLSYNQASTTQQLVQATAAGQGLELQPAFYSTSPQIMLELVLANRGAAVLPYLLVEKHLHEDKLLVLPIGTTRVVGRPIIAVQNRGRSLPPELKKTYTRLQKQLAQLSRRAEQAAN